MVRTDDDLRACPMRSISRPFWLSPRQIAIVPVVPALDGYAQEVQKKLWEAGFQADCDLDPGTTLNKKIRQNQLNQYNFIGGKIECGVD